MWKCPKCGRTFRNENQQHFCGKAPETIDDCILAQDESIQDQLRNMREVLRDELPNATEKISWWMGHNTIHFAAQKKHIGLYPGPEAVNQFSDKLDKAGCRYSKGAIQIPYRVLGEDHCRVLSITSTGGAIVSTKEEEL